MTLLIMFNVLMIAMLLAPSGNLGFRWTSILITLISICFWLFIYGAVT